MPHSADRLDRIEAILEAVAGQQARNTTAIAQLTQSPESVPDLTNMLGTLAQSL